MGDRQNAEEDPSSVRKRCWQCKSLPAPGSKLRYCGQCKAAAYCNKQCASADWNEHKVDCDNIRETNRRAIEAQKVQQGRRGGEGREGRQKDHAQYTIDIQQRFTTVPGLAYEVELLAWKHRAESPLIHVSFPKESIHDVDGSGIQVTFMPRGSWELPPFSSMIIKSNFQMLGRQFDEASFCPDQEFMLMLNREGQTRCPRSAACRFTDNIVRGIEITEALTAGEKPEDIADAFAWFRSMDPPHQADYKVQNLLARFESLYGIVTPRGSVPVPSRAINNEVAYMVLAATLFLQFEVRLEGLLGAAHLNGKEGNILSLDVANPARFTVRLDDGTCVSVKASNFVHIRRGEYKRHLP